MSREEAECWAARIRVVGIVLAGVILAHQARAAAEPRVIVSIKPVHSLVAAVMQGAGEPTLLISGSASPHTYSLKPSEARALQQAQVVFWVGEGLETFLQRPLAALPADTRIVTLANTDGVTLLPFRTGSDWQAHRHGAGEVDVSADDDEDDPTRHLPHHPGPDHSGLSAQHHAGDDDAADEARHQHAHTGADMHLWLDPDNARAIVAAAVGALSATDPARTGLYQRNGAAAAARIADLDADLRAQLRPVANRPYVVFHDAFHYLEHRYGLNPVGTITINPDRPSSARRVAEIRDRIVSAKVVCVFSEPQFQPALVTTLVEGTPAKTDVLDPIGGADIPAGPDAYFTIMRDLGQALSRCLSTAS